MIEYKSADEYNIDQGSIVTIGTFDGVHIGHKAILDRLVATGKNEGLDSVLLTFFPHPRMVLQKDSNIKLINTISEKKEQFKKIGLDHLIIQPFTKEFSRLSAMEFVRDILVNHLKIKKIIIGYDHRFGRNRTANILDLIEFGKTYNFEVEEINAQELNEVAISSTKIRKALADGDLITANQYLGYPFMISGKVVKGKAIGRTLNYPTANLYVKEEYKLIPKTGVYVVQAKLMGSVYFGITSIGTNPTLGGTEKTIETYFLDFEGNLYDRIIELEFLHYIREEETFKSIEDLKKAIEQDELFARKFILNRE